MLFSLSFADSWLCGPKRVHRCKHKVVATPAPPVHKQRQQGSGGASACIVQSDLLVPV